MITISTFNIQNDIKKFSNDKTDIILKYMKDKKIDVLCLQEVYSLLDKDICNKLDNKFNMYGEYRFFLKKLLNKVNEKTPIITKYKVLSNNTYQLPFLPTLLKRIVTKIEVEINNKKVSIYNTHLDFMLEFVKKRQLKKLLELIKNDPNPIILTGDFNLKTNKKIFLNFIEELKNINITHIDVKDKTWKPSRFHRAIDHIFISDEFKLISQEIVKDIPTSDHYPILIKIDLK